MASETKKSNFDLLIEQLERYPSLDKLHVQRNVALGAAVTALAILIQILDTGVKDLPLRISLYSCAVAIPMWVGLAGLVEYYIVLGPKSYAHRRSNYTRNLMSLPFLIGGVAVLAAIAGVLYHLEPHAAYAFGGAVAGVTALSIVFHGHLASWYNSKAAELNGDGT